VSPRVIARAVLVAAAAVVLALAATADDDRTPVDIPATSTPAPGGTP
jgi:hypothetical protein